jgi:hypothetical protein
MAWPTASSARRKGRPLNAKLAVSGKSIVARLLPTSRRGEGYPLVDGEARRRREAVFVHLL